MKITEIPKDLFGTNVLLYKDVIDYVGSHSGDRISNLVSDSGSPLLLTAYSFIKGELSRKPTITMDAFAETYPSEILLYTRNKFPEVITVEAHIPSLRRKKMHKVDVCNFRIPPPLYKLEMCLINEHNMDKIPYSLYLEAVYHIRDTGDWQGSVKKTLEAVI